MLKLYPAIKPYTDYMLEVNGTHNVYVEECGEPDGIPLLYLHDGPGAGCDLDSRRFFDPKVYRIILFDQRGCGRSKPHASIKENTTLDLIADIEKIRKHAKVEQWILFGGAWGATLALIYAQHYPKQVSSMILRGILLAREKDLAWFYTEDAGAAKIFPDYWYDFIYPINKSKQSNILQAYYELLTGSDEIIGMGAARAWAKWEAACATLEPNSYVQKKLSHPRTALCKARIASHYFINKIFMEENFILNHMSAIKHIPSIIIHGRYDMVCPLDNAFNLHNVWPESKLQIIRNAGHAASDPAIAGALIAATKEMAC